MQTMKSPYLELLKGVLTDTIVAEEPERGTPGFGRRFIEHYFRNPRPLTCVPRRRLDHIEACVRAVVREGIEGDLIEAGVWRGGVTVFMRAVLRELDERERVVWVADSFAGLPRPDAERFPKEARAFDSPAMQELGHLAVPMERVQEGFARLSLLDRQVRFLPGWFHESLPSAPIKRLALLRVDGDFYESTQAALSILVPLVSPGGFIIVDDYGEDDWTNCREAVDEFRAAEGIESPLTAVDEYCFYWRKASSQGEL